MGSLCSLDQFEPDKFDGVFDLLGSGNLRFFEFEFPVGAGELSEDFI
mgnify:CR=1 FL=1